jgi:hypothetical protein
MACIWLPTEPRETMMQVGSSTDLSAQLQALENAALGKYQSNQNFSFLLQQSDPTNQGGDASSSGAASDGGSDTGDTPASSASSTNTAGAANGYQLSGSFQAGEVYEVGTFGSNGQVIPLPQQEVQNELNALATARQAAYSDALQNFMTLSQASGQIGGGTFSDDMKFTADNGMVGGNFDTSFSLKPVGGGVPPANS